MSRQGRKILGGAMLAFGITIFALSIYLLVWGDGSWKWFVGIPDGLFAAYTGLAIFLYASGSRKTARDTDVDEPEPEPERKRGILTAIVAPFKNRRQRRREQEQAELAPGVAAVPSLNLNKGNRRDRYPLAATDGSHPLVSRRLDRYGHSYYGTDPRGDRLLVSPQLGLLAHDRDVDVDGHAA